MLDGGYGLFDGTLNPSAGTAITTTRVSTNVLDLLVGRDIGAGLAYDQELHVDVMQTFTGAGNLQIQLQCAPDNGAGAPGTFGTILETDAIVLASLTVGARIARYAWPVIQANFVNFASDINPPRFLRLNYVVTAGPFTGGSVLSYLSLDREERIIYPKNYVTA